MVEKDREISEELTRMNIAQVMLQQGNVDLCEIIEWINNGIIPEKLKNKINDSTPIQQR